ncbi:MAG: hypothetical protein RIQ29_709, partial [Pseudomonadota bacterium]
LLGGGLRLPGNQAVVAIGQAKLIVFDHGASLLRLGRLTKREAWRGLLGEML